MSSLPQWWPGGLAVGIAALVALNQLLTESQKASNLFGRFGRWIYSRSRARARMDTKEFAAAVREAVSQERQHWEDDETRALAALEGRLKFVADIAEKQQEQLTDLQFHIRCMTAYTEYEADWHHRLRMMILNAYTDGGVLQIESLPDHLHYAEFEKQCRDRGNLAWRSWGILR